LDQEGQDQRENIGVGVRHRMGATASCLGGVAAAVQPLLAVAAPGLFLFALHERAARRRAEGEASGLRTSAERSEQLRNEERRGRIRAEQDLRSAATGLSGNNACNAKNGLDSEDGGNASELGMPSGFNFHPIGTFRSCYRSRCGTPRQGGVVPDSLAVLTCSRDLNPAAALDGFEAFSHCWVLYVFHENTNIAREGRTTAKRRGQKRGRVPLWQGLCMKVAPPRCPELRVGVLACRTPHRPNPLGLSLARVVSIDAAAGEVTLAGLDVVDGTPCLDLKPYLPDYESLPTAAVPPWVRRSYEEPLMRVVWGASASESLDVLLGSVESICAEEVAGQVPCPICIKPFTSGEQLRKALDGTLALDIRSPLQKKLHPYPGPAQDDMSLVQPYFVGDLWFHELHVVYALLPEAAGAAATSWVRIERMESRAQALSVGGLEPCEESCQEPRRD